MLGKLIIFFICISSVAYGQEYENYTTRDGLPSNHIYHTIQDSKGFMWFATNRGIAKFDGINFKVFTTKDGLPNNDIWRLTADDQGRIWWNTKSKYQGYIENDSVHKFMTTEEEILISCFWKSNGKTLLIKEVQSTIYELKNNFFRHLEGVNTKKDYLRRMDIFEKLRIDPGILYFVFEPFTQMTVLVSDNKAIFYDTACNKVSEVALKPISAEIKSGVNNWRLGLLPNFSTFFVNSFGIMFTDFGEKKVKRYSFLDLVNKKSLTVFPIVISIGNEIHLSIQGHLFILNKEFEIIEKHTFPNFPSTKNSYKDRDGNIWLNDRENGIVLIPNTDVVSSKFLTRRIIQKIDKFQKRILAGEGSLGIHEYNYDQDSFVLQEHGRVSENIYQFKNNNKLGTFHVISYPSYEYDTNFLSEPNKISVSLEGTKSFSDEGFKNIEFTSKYCYMLNTYSIIKSDLKTKKEISSFSKAGLLVITQYKNKIYTGGSDGLFLYEGDTLIEVRGEGKMLQASITCMRSDSNYLYVGTDGRGVYLYDGEKEIHLKKTDGLIIQKIIRKKDKLWLATQEGVKEISLNLNKLEESEITDSYYDSDGLLQNNTNDIYMEDSLLWIATDIGLSRINTKNSIYKKKTPVVFDFNTDTVTYHYDRNSQTTIGFKGLNYTNQRYLKYEYRLLPSNKEWVKTTSQSINFSGLSPSLHTLEVKVTDQHNNESIGRQYIRILPAWWQTIWARGGLFLLIGILLYSLFKYIQSRIRVVERKKTKLAGLELQALRSQMNPHFVHNSLNAIKYFIQRNESELSEEYLVKFSKLIRLFFDFSRRENITLKEELLLLTLYLQIEQLRFEEKLSFSFEIDEKLDLEEELIPSMLLQPLVENAVNHGVFHKKGNGTVLVKIINIDASSYQVTIEDDGIGINKAKSIYKNSSENYQSKSSEVIKERLELLNQNEEWTITYTTLDLSENTEKEGTRVSLLFKKIQ